MAVPDVERADATGKVEIRVAIHVGDLRAGAGGRIDRVIGVDTARQIAFALRLKRLRAWARDRGTGSIGGGHGRRIGGHRPRVLPGLLPVKLSMPVLLLILLCGCPLCWG